MNPVDYLCVLAHVIFMYCTFDNTIMIIDRPDICCLVLYKNFKCLSLQNFNIILHNSIEIFSKQHFWSYRIVDPYLCTI